MNFVVTNEKVRFVSRSFIGYSIFGKINFRKIGPFYNDFISVDSFGGVDKKAFLLRLTFKRLNVFFMGCIVLVNILSCVLLPIQLGLDNVVRNDRVSCS